MGKKLEEIHWDPKNKIYRNSKFKEVFPTPKGNALKLDIEVTQDRLENLAKERGLIEIDGSLSVNAYLNNIVGLDGWYTTVINFYKI